jgi:hypothetical protein
MHRPKIAETFCARSSWSCAKAQDVFESMLDAGSALCAMCTLNLADATLEDISANTTELSQPKLFECLQLVCEACLTEATETMRCQVCQPIAQCQG